MNLIQFVDGGGDDGGGGNDDDDDYGDVDNVNAVLFTSHW